MTIHNDIGDIPRAGGGEDGLNQVMGGLQMGLVDIQQDQVSFFTRLKRANLLANLHGVGSTPGSHGICLTAGEDSRLADGNALVSMQSVLEQHHFGEVVHPMPGDAIRAQTHGNAQCTHQRGFGKAVVGKVSARTRHHLDLFVFEYEHFRIRKQNGVGCQHIGAQQTTLVEVLARTHMVIDQAVIDLIDMLGEVNMDACFVLAGSICHLRDQLLGRGHHLAQAEENTDAAIGSAIEIFIQLFVIADNFSGGLFYLRRDEISPVHIGGGDGSPQPGLDDDFGSHVYMWPAGIGKGGDTGFDHLHVVQQGADVHILRSKVALVGDEDA